MNAAQGRACSGLGASVVGCTCFGVTACCGRDGDTSCPLAMLSYLKAALNWARASVRVAAAHAQPRGPDDWNACSSSSSAVPPLRQRCYVVTAEDAVMRCSNHCV